MPPPAPTPVDLLRSLGAVFGRLDAAWYLFGAQAVLLWGRPRFTADIDVTVRMSPEEPERLVATMVDAGFRLRVEGTNAFVAATRVLPFVHDESGWWVDVVLAGPGLEERFLERAIAVDLGDTRVPVISPEDLIVTKVLSGRPKDIDDVHGVLMERRDRLDLAAIRETLGLLEAALGQSDLLPVFEQCLRDAGGR
jgi:hypothetical protein